MYLTSSRSVILSTSQCAGKNQGGSQVSGAIRGCAVGPYQFSGGVEGGGKGEGHMLNLSDHEDL